MELVRAVCLEDVAQLWELITRATYGLTTLQISKEQLSERVELSNFAFSKQSERPNGEPYVLVMEDTHQGKLVGLSCIFSKTGGYEPFYTYRRETEANHCDVLNTTVEIETLHWEKIHDGPTEIGSLFLSPEYRGQGRGRLLSLSRFMFIAAHPNRFAETVIAEMRGVMDDKGNCPFWEAIGRHFFQMDFPQADSLSTIDKRFIEALMPKHPIYVSMLPESAREILGEVHPQTKPALAMLESEGFQRAEFIDIFDGGPVVRCQRDEIAAVVRTEFGNVVDIGGDIASDNVCLVASEVSSFRALLSPVARRESGFAIPSESASRLMVKVGDPIAILPPYPPQTKNAAQQ